MYLLSQKKNIECYNQFNKMNKFNLNRQAKYIIAELLLGTIIIAVIAFFAVNNIQNKMDKTYANFAQLISTAIASQTSGLDNYHYDYQQTILAKKLEPFITKNNDISYIEYKDKSNNIISIFIF